MYELLKDTSSREYRKVGEESSDIYLTEEFNSAEEDESINEGEEKNAGELNNERSFRE